MRIGSHSTWSWRGSAQSARAPKTVVLCPSHQAASSQAKLLFGSRRVLPSFSCVCYSRGPWTEERNSALVSTGSGWDESWKKNESKHETACWVNKYHPIQLCDCVRNILKADLFGECWNMGKMNLANYILPREIAIECESYPSPPILWVTSTMLEDMV